MARRVYKFTDKRHTKLGIFSTVLGMIALLLLSAGIWMAYEMSGNAGSVTGLLGLLSMLIAAIGFFMALQGFHEEEAYYLFSQIGLLLNGILFILWVLIFVVGM